MLLGDEQPNVDNAQGFNDYLYNGSFGISLRVYQHFLQSARTGEVTYFDYGPEGNLEVYGSERAPEIPFENTNMPIFIYSSETDYMADPVDVEWYADMIGENLMSFEWISGGHFSNVLGNNMLYLEDVVENYQPIH